MWTVNATPVVSHIIATPVVSYITAAPVVSYIIYLFWMVIVIVIYLIRQSS